MFSCPESWWRLQIYYSDKFWKDGKMFLQMVFSSRGCYSYLQAPLYEASFFHSITCPNKNRTPKKRLQVAAHASSMAKEQCLNLVAYCIEELHGIWSFLEKLGFYSLLDGSNRKILPPCTYSTIGNSPSTSYFVRGHVLFRVKWKPGILHIDYPFSHNHGSGKWWPGIWL